MPRARYRVVGLWAFVATGSSAAASKHACGFFRACPRLRALEFSIVSGSVLLLPNLRGALKISSNTRMMPVESIHGAEL